MKDLKEIVNENIVNEAGTVNWTAFLTIDTVGGPGGMGKEVNFRADKAAEYMCIDLDRNQICFYSYQDIEEIDNANELGSELVNHVLDLEIGQSYYDKDAKQVFISIR